MVPRKDDQTEDTNTRTMYACAGHERKRKGQSDDARSIMDYEGKSNDSVSFVALARPSLFKTARFRSYIRGPLSLLIFFTSFFPSAPASTHILPLSLYPVWTLVHINEMIRRERMHRIALSSSSGVISCNLVLSCISVEKVRVALATVICVVSSRMILIWQCNFVVVVEAWPLR